MAERYIRRRPAGPDTSPRWLWRELEFLVLRGAQHREECGRGNAYRLCIGHARRATRTDNEVQRQELVHPRAA